MAIGAAARLASVDGCAEGGELAALALGLADFIQNTAAPTASAPSSPTPSSENRCFTLVVV